MPAQPAGVQGCPQEVFFEKAAIPQTQKYLLGTKSIAEDDDDDNDDYDDFFLLLLLLYFFPLSALLLLIKKALMDRNAFMNV